MGQPAESIVSPPPEPGVNPDGPTPRTLLALKSLHSRFLHPFFYEPHRVKGATEALEAASPAGRSGVWKCSDPRGLYREDILDHVTEFLFAGGVRTECHYLRGADAAVQSWFLGTELLLGDGIELPINSIPGIQMELFLSDYGVGVFSLALTPDQQRRPSDPGPALDEAINFNYRLAQRQRWSAALIRMPHPGTDPEALARLPERDRARLGPIPTSDAPLPERLGKRGGTFTLAELVDELLQPLKRLGLEPVQPIFSVYTVARLGPEVDFGLPEVRDQLAPLLSALAQVEEADHAGAPPGTVGVPNAILNRRHWAAVGQLGSAHLIADQPGDHPFNVQRLPRARDKYFVHYLLALLQRLVVHRAISRAGTIMLTPRTDRRIPLEGLRGDLMAFAVGGHFTQTSTRHSLQRFYQVAREGLGVADAWAEVRQAITDIDARHFLEQQDKVEKDVASNMATMAEVAHDMRRVAHKMDENLGHVTRVQQMVHWIEIVIVSVYFAHLWHMAVGENKALEEWVRETFPRWHGAEDWFVSIGVIVWAAIGFGLALLLMRVLHGKTEPSRENDPSHPTRV
jgi:hypothetical protein